ncbi:MAG: hypothetical protein ACHQQ3_13295, partial [Gemmatimonadales bacterium]
MTSRVRSALLVASLVLTAGCVINPRPRTDVVYVVRRPPVERVEVISVAPSPAHVWIAGHWLWREPEFVWVGGRWDTPAPGFRRWVPGKWDHDRHGWFWIEG